MPVNYFILIKNFSFFNAHRSEFCLLESNETIESNKPTEFLCTSYIENEYLILGDLDHPIQLINKINKTDYTIYGIMAIFFFLGLKIGPALFLAKRLASRKKCGGKFYIKFKNDYIQDAITISERAEVRNSHVEQVEESNEQKRSDEQIRKEANFKSQNSTSSIEKNEEGINHLETRI